MRNACPHKSNVVCINTEKLLLFVVLAIVCGGAVVGGSHRYLRKLAAAVAFVVVFACANVAHNGLLVFHSYLLAHIVDGFFLFDTS